MIEYIIAVLFFLYVYRGVRFFNIRRKDFSKQSPLPGAEPFFNKRGNVGVLFIHGFTSSCYDYIELGRYLASKDITNKAVLLDGHGTSPEHLMTKTDKDWKKSVVAGANELRKHCDTLFVCGDSMGGNLALWYASKYRVDGVISIGTPIFLKRERLLKFIFPFMRAFKLYQKKWYHKVNLDPAIVAQRVTYHLIPLRSAVYAARVIKETKKVLKKVKDPLLVMQSTTDFGVGEGSVDYIYRKSSSLVKQIVWIKETYHVVIVDKKKELAFRHIHHFIEQVVKERKEKDQG
jgi:carboxylesterase